jgi:hypothetical protein
VIYFGHRLSSRAILADDRLLYLHIVVTFSRDCRGGVVCTADVRADFGEKRREHMPFLIGLQTFFLGACRKEAGSSYAANILTGADSTAQTHPTPTHTCTHTHRHRWRMAQELTHM